MKPVIVNKTRFYSGILCFIFIIGGAIILLASSLFIETLENMPVKYKIGRQQNQTLGEMILNLKNFNIGVIAASTAGFLISLAIFISSLRRSVSKYSRIIDRLNFKKPGIMSLNIHFPERDEFGNLGTKLNNLIEHLQTFDKIKSLKLSGSNFKIKFMGDKIENAIAVVSDELRIIYSNESFIEKFQEKESKDNFMLSAVFESDELEKIIKSTFESRITKEVGDLIIPVEDRYYKCSFTLHPVLTQEDTVNEILIFFKEIKKSGKVKK
ncbi:MAG: hypothetical protein KAS64_04445 [Spirochaetes bacterium]|nr:hypothetical protein [Spirochaetota bacterium]